MKLTNAIWDEAVTGWKTCEVIFEKGDRYSDFARLCVEDKYDYCVVKIPIGDLETVHRLEDDGFRYVENQYNLAFEAKQLDNIDMKWERLLSTASYAEVKNTGDIDRIIKEVGKGMFKADRFSQDPLVPEGVSSTRYVNWIKELYNEPGTVVYELKNSGNKTGFFILNHVDENILQCPIAGLYKGSTMKGNIFSLVFFILEICRSKGAKGFVTSISSNNQNLLSSFSKAFTYRVNETRIVLRKAVHGK